jgi:hypothetical protein
MEKKEANHLDCAKKVIGGEAPGGAGFPDVEVGGVTRVPSGGSGRHVGHVISSSGSHVRIPYTYALHAYRDPFSGLCSLVYSRAAWR